MSPWLVRFSAEEAEYSVLKKQILIAAGLFVQRVRELRELLPRYEYDNLFESAKFKHRFPDFTVTTYREGLEQICREWRSQRTKAR